MVHRLPSGTRDVLPDEMRELRAMTERIHAVFRSAGYGEVRTPALEYEATYERAGPTAVSPAHRVFDEDGSVMVLRSDMTVPIARLVASRYQRAQPPLRFCYVACSYRGVRPRSGQARELMQAGLELIGAPGPQGTAEALSVLGAALDAAGLRTWTIGLGDASLYPSLLDFFAVDPQARERILQTLAAGDFVGVARQLGELALPPAARRLLERVPRIRGGAEVLEGLDGPLRDAVAGLADVHGLLQPAVAQRVIFDFGLVRSIGYYTGAVFRVYDPAYGVPLGSGGRYDELLARFGRALPAVGFALDVERLHIALTGEERAR
jgi:ATP phosphoribosyltransferase regulatory subunit